MPVEEVNGTHLESQHHYLCKRRHPSKASMAIGSNQERSMTIGVSLRTKVSRSLQSGKDQNQHTKETDGSLQLKVCSLLAQRIRNR